MAVQDYRVQGLCCAEEAAALRQELTGRPGILQLDVDVINARMTVEYDPDVLTPQAIAGWVNATGMKAVPWDQAPPRQPEPPWRRYGRLIMVAVSGAFLLAGLVSHWALHGSVVDALVAGPRPGHRLPPVSVALYVLSASAGAWYVLPRAWRAARRARPDMHLLMTIAVIGAVGVGEWFEAAAVAFLFALALMLEQWSVGRARRAIGGLLDIAPPTARRVDGEQGPRDVNVRDVPVGADVLVRPGERVPLDGVVTRGRSAVNQAPITGEAMPADKGPGDEVFAGTINQEGAIEVRTTRSAGDTTLARIVHMVEQAQSRRARAQQWVDRFALYYTPAMLLLALVVAIGPPLATGGDWARWFYQGLVILVIACPCALVISTPVTVVSALAGAARQGVLIKGGVYLELAGKLRAVAMDKTGTLTQGRPEVRQIVPFSGHGQRDLLEIAAALESHSEHPLGRAILRAAADRGLTAPAVEGFRAVKGLGAEARVDGRAFWIGSHRLMHDRGQETPKVHARALALEDAGHTVVAIGNDEHVCGLISLADRPRPNARAAVTAMKQAGMREVVMLTGDNQATARAIAREADVDACHAQLLPEDKVAVVAGLVSRHRHVAMVGDGINDAPAMAAATFGVAMAVMGADAAIETADVALMSDDLEKVPWLMRHSRRALRTIRQNIAFALLVKALFIALALAGAATLWMAIAADMGASLLVIFNGLRLLRQTA